MERPCGFWTRCVYPDHAGILLAAERSDTASLTSGILSLANRHSGAKRHSLPNLLVPDAGK